MKKAQINQIFVYIFSLLIISVIVLFSVRSIGGLFQTKCDTDMAKFSFEISNLVLKYKDFGVVEKHNLVAPCDNVFLCFIDSNTNYIFDESRNMFPSNFPLNLRRMTNMFHDGEKYSKNVFLYDNKIVYDLNYISGIEIKNENKIVCVQSRGKRFEFITQGTGRGVEIISQPDMFESAILTSFSDAIESQVPGEDIEMKFFVDVNKFDSEPTEDILEIASRQIENIEIINISVDEETGKLVYIVSGTTPKNLLAIIPLPLSITQKINSDGDVEDTENSWWSPFVTDN